MNHRRFHPDLDLPYTVVMVRLAQAPGCVLYGGWRADREPRLGEPVTAVFRDVYDELTLIDWAPREHVP